MSQRGHLLPRPLFLKRLAGCLALAGCLMGVSLAIGVIGYRYLGHLPWIDALLNASMILGGMEPVDALHGTAAKLFASAYALYSGLVLIAGVGLALAPVLHRVLHRFHLDDADIELPPADTP